MRFIKRIGRVFRQILRRKQFDAEIDEELQSCLDAMTEDNVRRGLPSDEAARRAKADFGSFLHVKECVRDARSEFMFDALWQDIRYGVRVLLNNRTFAATAVITLAIGIASATTVFNLVNTMLFQPPTGVVEPDRVFQLFMDETLKPGQDNRGFAYSQYEALNAVQDVFSEMLWYSRRPAIISVGDIAESMNMEEVSGRHFSMLGLMPALGRLIQPEDDVPGGPPVALLSYELWQTRFGGSNDVLNKNIAIDGKAFNIIGVIPKGYVGVNLDWYEVPRIWVPLHAVTYINPASDLLKTRGAWMPVIGRLKPSVTAIAAERRLSQLIPVVDIPSDKYKPDSVSLVSVGHARLNPRRRDFMSAFFGALMTVSILILLAACFNVGSFLIGRAATRKQEIAVRLALGANRSRIIQLLMTEAILLGILATGLGIVLAVAMSSLAGQIPRINQVQLYAGLSLDPRAIAFASGLGVLATLLFGLFPALMVSRRTPWVTLKNSTSGWVLSGFRLSLRQAILALQVALAAILAITGALYAQSLYNLSQVSTGFVSDHMILAQVNEASIDPPQRLGFDRQLMAELKGLPEVISVSMSAQPPSVGSQGRTQFKIHGDASEPYIVTATLVDEDYFKTVGIPLTEGREFMNIPEDRDGVIINGVLERQAWHGESAIGKWIETNGVPRHVIGVIPQLNCWDHLRDPDPCVYYMLDDFTTKTVELRVTSYTGIANSVRQTIRQLNSRVLVPDIKTIEDQLHSRIGAETVAAVATGVLATMGVLLSAIGCYAVFSSMVKESTREIALRMALGASLSSLLSRVMIRTAVLCTIGIVVGSGLAVWIAGHFQDQLFKVRPYDAGILTIVAVLLAGVAIVASFIPARLIAKTDPAAALKVV